MKSITTLSIILCSLSACAQKKEKPFQRVFEFKASVKHDAYGVKKERNVITLCEEK